VTLSKRDLRAQSDLVAASSSIVDLRLRRLSVELLTPVVREPLQVGFTSLDKQMSRDIPSHAAYTYTYRFDGTDRESHKIFSAEVALSLLFKLSQGAEISASHLRSFGSIGVVEIAHPYVRELIHSLSGRMGLPPIVVEVLPPVI
jgi:hypothetical protein